MNLSRIHWLAALFVLALFVSPIASAQDKARQGAEAAQAELIAASNAYRASLARVLELQQQAEVRAAEAVEKRKALLALGAIAKREVEEAEQTRAAAEAKMNETRRQIEETEQLMAEINAEEPEQPITPTSAPPRSVRATGALFRYVGASHWALSDAGKVEAFFRLKFGKPLPVSALGQTETHNRLGFDHRAALDVAVHPDSAEGQALMNYLRGEGISFIAIRARIPGSATGAHIHIGLPSKRTVLL
ncbi:MAG: hypothetical protein HOP19_02690 [Acidobacteria bacterium]|nr:hypothetical protein [Acidobacteriota bacterium]